MGVSLDSRRMHFCVLRVCIHLVLARVCVCVYVPVHVFCVLKRVCLMPYALSYIYISIDLYV